MQTSSPSIVSTRNKLIWFLLTVIGTVTYIAGYFFPQALKVHYQVPKSCPKTIYNALGYSCDNFNSDTGSTFAFEITNVIPENEFAALQGLASLNNNAKSNELALQVEVSAYAVDNDYTIKAVYTARDPKTINLHCDSVSPSNTAMCHPETFVEVVGLSQEHYVFVVRFLNAGDFSDQLDSFRPVITTYNADFASYLAILKIGLFAFAVIGYAIYRGYLTKISTEVTSSEQRYIGYMGLILILFNQPFFQYAPSEESFFLDVYGVVTASAQSAILVLFWFVLVERLASADAVLSSGGKAFIKVFALIHFGASVVGYTLLAQSQSSNPEEDLSRSRNSFVVLYRVYLIGFAGIVSLWTVIRLLRIIRKYKELDWRDSTAFTFSFCYVLCYLFFIVTGSLQVTSYRGARVVLLFGITTLYSLLLQVIYAPFEHEIEESDKRRKYETPETHGQFGELDMSDASSPNIKNDNIQLRKADQNQRSKDAESYDEV